MAYYSANGPGSEEEANFYQNRNNANKAFQQSISTQPGMDAYNQQVAQTWSDIQNHTGAYQDFGGGGFLDSLGKFMEPIMNAGIAATPYLLAGSLGMAGAGALGAAGAAGTDAAGAGALGAAGSDAAGAALGAGAADAGAGAASAAGAGGLGSMIGVGSGAMPVVTIGAPAAAASGTGLGTMFGAGAVGAGIGAGLGGLGNTPIPNDPSLQNLPQFSSQEPIGVQGGDIPSVIVPSPAGAGSSLGNPAPINYTPPVVPIPLPSGLGDVPNIPNPGSGSGGSSTPVGIPGGAGSILGGLGSILGGAAGYQMNQADKDYWQNLMDKAMGMYQPGTPEADMLEHKMEAQDAAAGRNSQYGIREQNLAATLSQQRANIMMSPQFYKMGEAARGHYDDSLNNIFGALGSATGNSNTSSALNNLFGMGSSMWNDLSGMFGSGSSNGSVANTLF